MSQQSNNSAYETQIEPTKRKIELCRAFAELGGCPYGEFCMFAHGVDELLLHQPALKAKKCRNFYTNGYCRYGERCNFRHDKLAKLPKKKNLYKFHKILNSYPDLILCSLLNHAQPKNLFASSAH